MIQWIPTHRDAFNLKAVDGWRGAVVVLAALACSCAADGGTDDGADADGVNTGGDIGAGGTSTGGDLGAGGASAGGADTGGDLNTGGLNTGGDVGAGGLSTGGDVGAGGASTGGTGTGGDVGAGGMDTATGGMDGSGGAVGNGPFVCNQVTGFTVTSEWYLAGFENGVDDSRWQLKWQSGSYVDKWADPNGEPWSAVINSPCSSSSTSPDRIVWVVLSWEVYTQQQWEALITDALSTFDIKYPNVKQYDLLTIVRGPNNEVCPPPDTAETVKVPAELDAAISAVAAQSEGRIVQGPKFEATDCASTFDGAGPHLISPGVEEMAGVISAYYVDNQ